jgi:4-hydroxyisophthalate hydroxylase
MATSRVIGTSVVIVGGGPVGLALAAALGQARIRCVLIERQLTPSAVPKGQNLSARSLEHFYFWGCAGELHAARLLPAGFPIGGITAYEDLASEYWYAPAGRETVAGFYYERNERLPQYLTEEVLRGRVREFDSVRAMFGWSVTGVSADSGGARVTAVHDSDGQRCEIQADYVVGCDGARSAVREQAGIGSGGSDFDQRMVLAVFRSPELHARLGRFPLRTTYRVLHPELKGYWWFFGRVDAADTFFFHAPVRKDAAENFDAHALIERAAGAAVSCTFEHVGFWDLRIDLADGYRRGRVFIAGDAAHSHPPYGAHGLNTGLEDAVNLGWKLAAALDGWGGPGLLDSYEQERRPVFAETGEVITEGIERDRAFLERYSPRRNRREFELAWSGMTGGETAPPWYEPHYEGSPIVWGPPGSACSVRGQHTFEARAGHHLAPAVLSSGRNVFEQLGSGTFSLLALAGDPEGAEPVLAAAKALRVPLRLVADTAGGQRAAYGRRFILVRPDQHVAWAGDDLPADPAAVLRRAVGLPAAG